MISEREKIAALLVQRDQMLQIIGALVERVGGEAVILPKELAHDRRVTCEQNPIHKSFHVTTHRE